MKHLIQRPASRRRCTLASSITHILTGGTLLLVGAVASTSAFAQEKATNLDRITVTGSNIPRTNTETPSPVQVVTRQEIDRTGKTTVAEYLQTITANGAGSIPKSFGNGFAGGGAGISLRGLGAGSTLVLLNGRRMATYGLADDGQKVFTDLSTIPLDAVERVEVLKDGASAIYGSDAIAGVVNIILRSDFQGAILRGSYGVSGDGDGDTRKATLTAGTGDMATDGWNAFFSLDVGKSDAIKISDRRTASGSAPATPASGATATMRSSWAAPSSAAGPVAVSDRTVRCMTTAMSPRPIRRRWYRCRAARA